MINKTDLRIKSATYSISEDSKNNGAFLGVSIDGGKLDNMLSLSACRKSCGSEDDLLVLVISALKLERLAS